ncbi:MAG: diacylglycerol kinase family lipid kinase [Thermodesulfobacteriota bacterium]|nr:MAG: diacylglycerol kinase family lipid kinase [Thermodesulfobacteriota bacterium]
MKVRFILNPSAGRSGRLKSLSGAVKKVLDADEGIFEIRSAADRSGMRDLAADAAAKGYEVVFACGGDGTINDIASELVGKDTALGILPTGSGNALARALRIPEDVEEAVRLLKTGRVNKMDVGVACGRYFFSTAGFAFEARLSRRYNEGRLSRRLRGLSPYFVLALFEFLRFRPGPVRLSIDGKDIDGRPLLLTAANTSHLGGGAVIAPGAENDDGLLDFCFVHRTGIFSALGLARRLLNGSIEKHGRYETARGRKAVVMGRDIKDAHVDGEPFQWKGEVEISVLYRKLNVLVPS